VKTAWTFDWTDAAIARLTELWLAGHSSGECAKHFGITRSAAIGKIGRLGLLRSDRPRPAGPLSAQYLLRTEQNIEQAIPVPKPRPEKRPHKRNKRPAKTPDRFFAEFAAKPPPPPRSAPAYGTLKVLDLRHNSCRWPEGDGPIFVFCGRPQAPLSSYCPEHRALAHARGSQRDFDRAADAALGGKLFASRAGVME